jgi:4-amino-4-deoxy-L-arabinose transferase-like glycosyltransferase
MNRSSITAWVSALDRRGQWLLVGVVILITAFVIRCCQFGNPLIQVDENFYLLVGDRMLHGGALPYVDIWDRKPVGLFLLFAGIRLLGGDGIVQYQIVATLFAAGTALLIVRIAEPMAGLLAGVMAGIVYILLLGLLGGSGGQAPVFYNLFVAGAALATLIATTKPVVSAGEVRRLGCIAMVLVGIALQLKYTALFEGLFFGVALLLASWKTSRRIDRLVVDGALWVAIALAPTLAALTYYAWIGETPAFVYANFLSIGARSNASADELLHRLAKAWKALHLPVFAVVLTLILKPWRAFPRGKATFCFVMAWLGAALAGYLVFGTYFTHYALPLTAPIAAAGAPLFRYRRGRRRLGLIAAAVMLVAGGTAYAAVIHKAHLRRGTQKEMAAVVAAIRPRLTNCLYVWNGEAILYHLTGSCLPTRHPFPGHLNLLREHGAIGVDQAQEVRRILSGKPSVIVDESPIPKDFNFEAVAIVQAELARNYRPVAEVPTLKSKTIVYARLPGH